MHAHRPTLLCALASAVLIGSLAPQPASAKNLMECRWNVRVGSSLVVAGDDAQRAYSLFKKHSKWKLVRSSQRSQVWRREGRQANTVRLKLADGKIDKICQSMR